mmetsp:Transcript_4029/g.10040  ORF Transcript_4029/g.10040 Transcript_4029/m.10040 type:complete len:578 (-) Transcript_4029:668-2401(-)
MPHHRGLGGWDGGQACVAVATAPAVEAAADKLCSLATCRRRQHCIHPLLLLLAALLLLALVSHSSQPRLPRARARAAHQAQTQVAGGRTEPPGRTRVRLLRVGGRRVAALGGREVAPGLHVVHVRVADVVAPRVHAGHAHRGHVQPRRHLAAHGGHGAAARLVLDARHALVQRRLDRAVALDRRHALPRGDLAHLDCVQQVLRGGVDDGLVQVPQRAGQRERDVALPGLREQREPLGHLPVRQHPLHHLEPVLELRLHDGRPLVREQRLEVEQRHDVRVGLAHQEVVHIEHLAQRLHWQVKLERAVPPAALQRVARAMRVQLDHLPAAVAAHDVLRRVQAGEGGGRGHSRPDERLGRCQVVEQAGGLVGVRGAHRHVEDAACALVRLQERAVAQQLAQLLDHERNVLQVALVQHVAHQVHRAAVLEERDVEAVQLGEGLTQLVVGARAHNGAHNGSDAGACQHARQHLPLKQRLAHADVEGAQAAAAAQQQRGAPKRVACDLEERQLLLQRQLHLGPRADLEQLLLHLPDVLLDGGGDGHKVLALLLALCDVGNVADEIDAQAKHDLSGIGCRLDFL